MKKSFITFLLGAAMALGVGLSAGKNSVAVQADYSGDSPYVINVRDTTVFTQQGSNVNTLIEATCSGVSLKAKHLNSSNGQVKVNSTNDGNFWMYSDTALPGKITSITISADSGINVWRIADGGV